MSEGIVTNIDYRPIIKTAIGGVVVQQGVQVTIEAQMSNEDFDQLAAALRSPTHFKVIIEKRMD